MQAFTTKVILGIFSVAAFNLSSVNPVMSIPFEDVQKKLSVIAVFALVDEKGRLLEVNRDDVVIIPAYLNSSSAKKQLNALLGAKKGFKGALKAFSLNRFYDTVEKLRESAASLGKKLDAPVVVEESDMVKAREILRSQGVSDEDISKGVRVPVFFTEPMITSGLSSGTKKVFFVSYEQLREGIAALPEDKREGVQERVADIDAVLDLIKNTNDDNYVFMASRDYLDLRESYLRSLNGGKK